MDCRNTRPTTGGRARRQSECVDSVSGSQRPDPACLPPSVAAPVRPPSGLSTPRSDGPESESDAAASPGARRPAETAGSGGARVGRACPRALPHVGSSSPRGTGKAPRIRSEEHTSELQSRQYLVCRLLLEKKKYVQGTEA